MRQLNYHHLYYFFCVAQEKNLSRAAIKIGISTSALSLQIKSLETQLGVSLFDRTKGRGLVLTEEGKLVLSRSQEIFSAGRNLLFELSQNQKVTSIRIGSAVGLMKETQVRVIEKLNRHFPGARITMKFCDGDLLTHHLSSFTFDLILTDRCVQNERAKDIRQLILFSEPMCLVGRPLTQAMGWVEAVKCRGVFLPTEDMDPAIHFQPIDATSLDASINGFIQDLALMRKIALATDSLVVAPKTCVLQELTSGSLRCVKEFSHWSIQQYAAVSSRSSLGKKLLLALKNKSPRNEDQNCEENGI